MTVGRHMEYAVTVEGTDIVDVQEFVYLGSKIIANGESDTDMQAQMNKATGVFERLRSI